MTCCVKVFPLISLICHHLFHWLSPACVSESRHIAQYLLCIADLHIILGAGTDRGARFQYVEHVEMHLHVLCRGDLRGARQESESVGREWEGGTGFSSFLLWRSEKGWVFQVFMQSFFKPDSQQRPGQSENLPPVVYSEQLPWVTRQAVASVLAASSQVLLQELPIAQLT